MEAERKAGDTPGGEPGDVHGAVHGFLESSRVAGEVRVPRSKSIAQRALVCASLAAHDDAFRLEGIEPAGDVLAAAIWLESIVRIRVDGDVFTVLGPSIGWPDERFPVGESGTFARLATAVTALCAPRHVDLELVPSGTLAKRHSAALFAALRGAGAELTGPADAATDGWPVRVRRALRRGPLRLERPTSSQEVSALLIALAASSESATLTVVGEIPSRPYLGITESVLAAFGVAVHEERRPDGTTRFEVRGPLRAPDVFRVEPDASAAAVALAAGCLSGGEVRVSGLGSDSATRQGDARIVEHLAAAGCDARSEPSCLVARGAPTRPFDLDLTGEPDLAPVLAAVAARAAWDLGSDAPPSRLTGLGTLPGKESSRIEVLARGLADLGFDVRAADASLSVAGGRAREAAEERAGRPRVLDPAGDHRMAFCFALCSLFVPGVLVAEPGCVGKSWPGFWDDLAAAGARLVRV